MIANSKLQKKMVYISQLTMAAITVIWLILLGIMLSTRWADEVEFLWPFIFSILFALPCVPFIIANLVMGIKNISYANVSTKKIKFYA